MRQEKRPKRRCGDCVHCNGDAYKMIRIHVCYEIGTTLGGGQPHTDGSEDDFHSGGALC